MEYGPDVSCVHLRTLKGAQQSILHLSVLDDHVAQDNIPHPLKVDKAGLLRPTTRMAGRVPSQSIDRIYIERCLTLIRNGSESYLMTQSVSGRVDLPAQPLEGRPEGRRDETGMPSSAPVGQYRAVRSHSGLQGSVGKKKRNAINATSPPGGSSKGAIRWI